MFYCVRPVLRLSFPEAETFERRRVLRGLFFLVVVVQMRVRPELEDQVATVNCHTTADQLPQRVLPVSTH